MYEYNKEKGMLLHVSSKDTLHLILTNEVQGPIPIYYYSISSIYRYLLSPIYFVNIRLPVFFYAMNSK